MSNSEITLNHFEKRCAAVRDLIASFRSGKMDQSVLLCGAAGVGKSTLAALLAQGLLCREDTPLKPCGVCRSCLRVIKGTHPDCLKLQPEKGKKNVSVDNVREVLNILSRSPLEGTQRAVLVPRMEQLTDAAQNALLKTLEEKQNGTWFLLTTDNETKVLSTIRSRCRLVRVAPFPENEIVSVLLAEGVPASRAETAAALSEGSLTSAREIALDDSFDRLQELTVSLLLSGSGLGDYAGKAAVFKNIKDQTDDILRLGAQEIRLLIRRSAAGEKLPDWAEGIWSGASIERCRAVLEMILQAQRLRQANVSALAVMDVLVQQIMEETQTWSL